MPELRSLRRLRRDRRAGGTRRRKRRNLVKFIPESDSDFACIAEHVFLDHLKRRPAEYGVSQEDIASIAKVVSEFRSALTKTSRRFTRNPKLVMRKDEARASAEAIIRRYANVIRANPNVTDSNKRLLRLKLRPKKLGKRICPRHPPMLLFAGSGDGVAGGIGVGSGSGVHVLKFYDGNEGLVVQRTSELGLIRRMKPDGAVRIELYFDAVAVGEPVPRYPGERGGWPKYLRSFSRSPIEVEFPIPMAGPMLVVYWARWADHQGNVSRFSTTCVARVEGWTAHALPGADEAHALMEGEAEAHAMRNLNIQSGASYYIAERQVRFLEQFVDRPQRQLEAVGSSMQANDELA